MNNTAKKIALWLLWLGLAVYAFGFAPPNQPDTLDLIVRLSTGQIQGINPLIVALFNIMGVFPLVYSCLLFFDGRMQKVPAYPFAIASFAVGAFALLPYLALRAPNGAFVGQKNLFLKLLDARWFGGILAIAATLLVFYGITQGDWANFVNQWRSDRFIHVMSLDFCLLCLLFPILLQDDVARRGWSRNPLFWAFALVPLLGATAYLALRPPIQGQASPTAIDVASA